MSGHAGSVRTENADRPTEVADWLRVHGWAITTETNAEDLIAVSNRAVPLNLDNAVPESVFVETRLH
jgi:O-methyltransferase involved in polyketide biosynthesis